MSTDIVMSDAEIDRTYRLAKALAASRFFKDSTQAEQAFAKMLLGRDLGLTPTQAMTAIHVVEGKPELSANLQATLVRTYKGVDGERYDYKQKRLDDEGCVLEFKRKLPGEEWESLGESSFTLEDAKKAGLAGKGVWQKYPRNMLFARAMSNGVAFMCPEVTGGVRVYSEGEISGDEKPPEVEATVVQLPAPRPEDPPSDIPEDFHAEPAQAPSEATPATDGVIVVDDSFARQIGEELKALNMDGAKEMRQFFTDEGVTGVPDDLRSREARWEFLKGLSLEDAIRVEKVLRDLVNAVDARTAA